jgi:hypothetical protein
MLRAMWFPAPSMPAFPSDQTTTTEYFLRYEDCTQDGRLNTRALPQALTTLWRTIDVQHPGARNAIAAGVLPILTRLTVSSLDAPIVVEQPVVTVAGFAVAHDVDAAGSVSKLFMNVWADVRGIPGRSGSPQGTERALVGHAFAEHTFTRLFAPPAQRRVTSLAGIDGYPALPPARYEQPLPVSAADAPAGASWHGELRPDTVDVRFTLDQSDANQHVNSNVYVRCFLDAFQRRLADDGLPATLRSKAFDIAYRKPCFVGERVRAHIRLFTHGDHVGGAGFLAAPGEASPRCYLRVVFGP